MNSVLGEVARAVNGEITCGGPLIKIKIYVWIRGR